MHEQLWFTELLNKLIGAPVSALLNAIGVHPHDAHNPIPDFVAMQVVVALIMLIFFVLVRSRLSVESPNPFQHMAESIHEMMANQAHDTIGHGYKRYVPWIVTMGLFIVLGNLLVLIPRFLSPTLFPAAPLGGAMATVIYYNA